tara:strand:- start:1511 stop:2131 length:621 start_codon:yes stop_codon:yes gene_type:complete
MKYLDLSKTALKIFKESITKYHIIDKVDQIFKNPYTDKSLSNLLYKKNWIDTVQWHLEDIIRDPLIESKKGMEIKRKIDLSNQKRTDLVEYIDDFFLDEFKKIKIKKNGTHNSETLAWALDRLSILALKIYHMNEEVEREETSDQHKNKCKNKLEILNFQKEDLSQAIDQLIYDIQKGIKYIKVYKQMKMYNDVSLNPILYKKKNL